MMRDNRSAKKLILLVALIALVGAGFGFLSDDLSPVLVSYADDPAVPAPAGSAVMLNAADPLSAPLQALEQGNALDRISPPDPSFGGTSAPAPQTPGLLLVRPQRC